MVSRQAANISAYAFPTPSPSPPWDRGQALQQQQQQQQQYYQQLLLQQQQQQQHHQQLLLFHHQQQLQQQQQDQLNQHPELTNIYQQVNQQQLQQAAGSSPFVLPQGAPQHPTAGTLNPAAPGFGYHYYYYPHQLTPSSSLTPSPASSLIPSPHDASSAATASDTSSAASTDSIAAFSIASTATTSATNCVASASVKDNNSAHTSNSVPPINVSAATPSATSTTPSTSTPSTLGEGYLGQQQQLVYSNMAQIVNPQMMIVPATATAAAGPASKDSRWLTLEVCREFQRSKCSRSDNECKFAHPPPHVEVQNGRVVACFDSIKGKCQRKDPPCKYLHPPQHLREQLLQNGRNNLILKNMQWQAYQQYSGILPVAGPKAVAVPTATVMPAGHYPYLNPYAGLQALSAMPAQAAPAAYSPYITTSLTSIGMPTTAEANPIMASQQIHASMLSTQPKAVRADKFENPTDGAESVTSHASLVDAYSLSAYIPQPGAAPGAAIAPQLVYAKKRARDPADDLLLSTMPGMVVPPYKRIAVGDIKGGIPVYQTNPVVSPLQPASLMQLPQQPSYIPMSFAGHPPSVPRF